MHLFSSTIGARRLGLNSYKIPAGKNLRPRR
nr:MAG TPA: hypothetical protein [Caudoviricetes sp.]